MGGIGLLGVPRHWRAVEREVDSAVLTEEDSNHFCERRPSPADPQGVEVERRLVILGMDSSYSTRPLWVRYGKQVTQPLRGQRVKLDRASGIDVP